MKPPAERRKATQPDAPKAPDQLQKAAIIMMALDEDRSQRLIGELDEDEIRRISRAMANLGRTETETVEQVVAEFRAEVGKTGNIFGTIESTERILRRILPNDRVAELMDEIRGPEGRNTWEKLANISPDVLAAYLRNEHPQTAAVILGRLPAQHAARVMRHLPENLVSDISLRLVRMENIQRTTLTDIEETLKREFMTNLSRSYERDCSSIVAEMLNRSEPDMVNRIMDVLESHEPQAAVRIRRIMFTFDDLVRVDRGTFGVLIAECPLERLPIALSGASADVRELFLGNMSERASAMMREEIETLPLQRRKTVDDAQSEIIAIARRLSDAGKIFILDDEEAEMG
jgi:flagellar motor switch protein FliG